MTDYLSAADAFAAIDAAHAEVRSRLRALADAKPAARTFASSVLVDLDRHAEGRAMLRRRLGLAGSASPAPEAPDDPLSLEGLRAAQERLVYAHAEGLPAIGD